MISPAYTGKLHLWKGSFNSSDIIAPVDGLSIPDFIALVNTQTVYVSVSGRVGWAGHRERGQGMRMWCAE